MKITGIELIPITVRFQSPFEESFGTVGKKEDNVIVRIHTEERISGVGEACTLGPFYCGESQETVMGIIANHLYPKVLEGEDPFNIDPIHYKMDKVVYGNTVAKAAIDYALHDIMGKALAIPVYKLLGGKFCDKIPIRGSVGIDTPENMGRKAGLLREQGFTGIKMKVGLNPPEDIERVRAVRAATGSDTLIDVDVNGAYSPKDAIYVLKRIADCGNIIVEQPVDRDDLSGMALVRKAVDVPIGACEAALSQQQIMRVIKYEAADFFNFKMSRSCGLFPAKQCVRMIEAAGLFAVASEQLGSSIELSAMNHFAVSTRSLAWPCGFAAGVLGLAGKNTTEGMTADVVDQPVLVKDGFLYAPGDRPGLGVMPVEEKWRRYLTPHKEVIRLGKTDAVM